MKDIHEVIRQKEADLQRIQHEIEALRLSARLLEEAGRPTPVQVLNTATVAKPQTVAQPVPPVNAWATAKQFP